MQRRKKAWGCVQTKVFSMGFQTVSDCVYCTFFFFFFWKNTGSLSDPASHPFRVPGRGPAPEPLNRVARAGSHSSSFFLQSRGPPPSRSPRGARRAATHLLGVLAQGDAQALEPLLQLADVHHAVPVAVQLLEEGLVARRRLGVLAGRRGQHEAPQPAQHGPGGTGRPSRGRSGGPRAARARGLKARDSRRRRRCRLRSRGPTRLRAQGVAAPAAARGGARPKPASGRGRGTGLALPRAGRK